MKEQIPDHPIHHIPRVSRLDPPDISRPPSVTAGIPNNPLMKRTQSLTVALVIFTGLLVSLTPSDATDCYSSGTSYRDGGGCICNPTYSGGKCNKRNHMGPDGQIKFQAILGPINWDDGKKLCENSGMDMGTPWSEEDNIAMYNLFKPGWACWIGISNAANRREWRYMSGGRKGRLLWYGERNGSPQNGYYTNWHPHQPSSSRFHPPGGDEIRRENSGEIFHFLNGSWNDWENYSISQCVMCETPRISPDNHTQTQTTAITSTSSESNTISSSISSDITKSLTHSISDTSTAEITPTNSLTVSESVSLSKSDTPTISSMFSRSASVSFSGTSTMPLTETVEIYAVDHQCYDGPFDIKPTMISDSDLLVNGEFVFTIGRPPISHAGQVLEPIVEGLLGVGTAGVIHVSECNMTTSKGFANPSYRCRFPSSFASLPDNGSSIFLRYMPSLLSRCPLGSVAVSAAPRVLREVVNVSSAPVCPVMTNFFLDGSVFVMVATSPCASVESQQGGKVATHIIAPLSFFGSAAAVFGNICVIVLCWLVVYIVLYLGKRAKWDIIIRHPIMKYTFGFRATLLGIWFWLAELTYPGVVVGTFGLIRAGYYFNIGLVALIVGCVHLVLVPVMAMVVMGPLRSGFVTYEEVSCDEMRGSMCQSLLTPQGMWGGTGPVLGPVTQPFAGIRKAAWFAPLRYIMMVVIGAVLHGVGPSTSCVMRLSAVAVLLAIVGVVIAVTRPCRYAINSLLYTVTFVLLAVYTALLTITASRHDEAHKRQEDSSYRVGFAQLGIGVYILLVFLVRGAVFVIIVIREGHTTIPMSIQMKDSKYIHKGLCTLCCCKGVY